MFVATQRITDPGEAWRFGCPVKKGLFMYGGYLFTTPGTN